MSQKVEKVSQLKSLQTFFLIYGEMHVLPQLEIHVEKNNLRIIFYIKTQINRLEVLGSSYITFRFCTYLLCHCFHEHSFM